MLIRTESPRSEGVADASDVSGAIFCLYRVFSLSRDSCSRLACLGSCRGPISSADITMHSPIGAAGAASTPPRQGGEYGLYVWLGPGRGSQCSGNTHLAGSAWLCTPSGKALYMHRKVSRLTAPCIAWQSFASQWRRELEVRPQGGQLFGFQSGLCGDEKEPGA